MCLIAKNEREQVRPCLESFGDHVDEIVFVDTGSRDGTVAEARRVAREHGWTDKLVLGRFPWNDDFAAARNYAESLATSEFVCNTDLDDTVVGAENLRTCCESLTPDVGSMTGANMLLFECCYYGRWVWWQRLTRRGAFPYVFRVADPRPVRGGIGTVARDICHWMHRRDWHERPPDRHVRRAERWVREDPTCPQARFELAYELVDAALAPEAVRMLRAYLAECPERRDELEALLRQYMPRFELEWLKPLRLSMCLIARNEAHNVERCFSSWWDAVDEVVFCDTGSTDCTIETVRAFASERGEPAKLKLSSVKWRDDFAAARNYADSLATGDLLTYCDLDETIEGAEHLRAIAEDNPGLSAFAARRQDADAGQYEQLARDARCAITGLIWQCVMVRAGAARWEGALHAVWNATENGGIPPSVCRWIHHKSADKLESSYRFYTRIVTKAARKTPNDPRAVGELALTLLQAVALGFSNDRESAVAAAERYFSLPDWHRSGVDGTLIASQLYLELRKLGRHSEASPFAARAISESIAPSGGTAIVPLGVAA